jgi:hypothetical protein
MFEWTTTLAKTNVNRNTLPIQLRSSFAPAKLLTTTTTSVSASARAQLSETLLQFLSKDAKTAIRARGERAESTEFSVVQNEPATVDTLVNDWWTTIYLKTDIEEARERFKDETTRVFMPWLPSPNPDGTLDDRPQIEMNPSVLFSTDRLSRLGQDAACLIRNGIPPLLDPQAFFKPGLFPADWRLDAAIEYTTLHSQKDFSDRFLNRQTCNLWVRHYETIIESILEQQRIRWLHLDQIPPKLKNLIAQKLQLPANNGAIVASPEDRQGVSSSPATADNDARLLDLFPKLHDSIRHLSPAVQSQIGDLFAKEAFRQFDEQTKKEMRLLAENDGLLAPYNPKSPANRHLLKVLTDFSASHKYTIRDGKISKSNPKLSKNIEPFAEYGLEEQLEWSRSWNVIRMAPLGFAAGSYNVAYAGEIALKCQTWGTTSSSSTPLDGKVALGGQGKSGTPAPRKIPLLTVPAVIKFQPLPSDVAIHWQTTLDALADTGAFLNKIRVVVLALMGWWLSAESESNFAIQPLDFLAVLQNDWASTRAATMSEYPLASNDNEQLAQSSFQNAWSLRSLTRLENIVYAAHGMFESPAAFGDRHHGDGKLYLQPRRFRSLDQFILSVLPRHLIEQWASGGESFFPGRGRGNNDDRVVDHDARGRTVKSATVAFQWTDFETASLDKEFQSDGGGGGRDPSTISPSKRAKLRNLFQIWIAESFAMESRSSKKTNPRSSDFIHARNAWFVYQWHLYVNTWNWVFNCSQTLKALCNRHILGSVTNGSWMEMLVSYAVGQLWDFKITPIFTEFLGYSLVKPSSSLIRIRQDLNAPFMSLFNRRILGSTVASHVEFSDERVQYLYRLDYPASKTPYKMFKRQHKLSYEIIVEYFENPSDLSAARLEKLKAAVEFRTRYGIDGPGSRISELFSKYVYPVFSLKGAAGMFAQVLLGQVASQSILGFTHYDEHAANTMVEPTAWTHLLYIIHLNHTGNGGKPYNTRLKSKGTVRLLIPTCGWLVRLIDFGFASCAIRRLGFNPEPLSSFLSKTDEKKAWLSKIKTPVYDINAYQNMKWFWRHGQDKVLNPMAAVLDSWFGKSKPPVPNTEYSDPYFLLISYFTLYFIYQTDIKLATRESKIASKVVDENRRLALKESAVITSTKVRPYLDSFPEQPWANWVGRWARTTPTSLSTFPWMSLVDRSVINGRSRTDLLLGNTAVFLSNSLQAFAFRNLWITVHESWMQHQEPVIPEIQAVFDQLEKTRSKEYFLIEKIKTYASAGREKNCDEYNPWKDDLGPAQAACDPIWNLQSLLQLIIDCYETREYDHITDAKTIPWVFEFKVDIQDDNPLIHFQNPR